MLDINRTKYLMETKYQYHCKVGNIFYSKVTGKMDHYEHIHNIIKSSEKHNFFRWTIFLK